MQNKLQTISNKELLLSNDNSNLSVSQFGVYVYGISDIIVNYISVISRVIPNESLYRFPF